MNGVDLEMEVNILHDRGSPLVLQPSPLKLQTFTREVIIPKGEAEVKVKYRGQTIVSLSSLHLESGQCCYWLSDLYLNWNELAQQHQVHRVIGDAVSVKDQLLGGAGKA